MDHDRLGPAAVLRDVLELALGREVEVNLHGDECLVLALGGVELHIDLRTIERGLALSLGEVEADLLQDAAQEGFAGLPHRRIVDVLLVVVGVTQGEAVRVVFQAQDTVDLFHQL